MVVASAWRALVCVALSGLAGCVETGDFGRVKNSAWNRAVAGTGSISAAARGESVSPFPFTDDEAELRDRAWRFLVPARNRPWFDRFVAELVATRIIPADLIEPNPSAYYHGLLQTDARSPASLYRRTGEDAAADLRLVEPFALVARRVLAADRIRLAAVARIEGVVAGEVADAEARVAENRCTIAWVTAATLFRAEAYRYALQHLVIAAPQVDAVPTERSIRRLAEQRVLLDALGVPPRAAAACAGGAGERLEPTLPARGVAISRKG